MLDVVLGREVGCGCSGRRLQMWVPHDISSGGVHSTVGLTCINRQTLNKGMNPIVEMRNRVPSVPQFQLLSLR